jgi:Flp pilus assembly protein TadD
VNAGFAQFRIRLADHGWLPHAGILLLAVLAYVNSFPGAFILDDLALVRDNPLVAHPRLWPILTSDYWGGDTNSGLYRPLTILSFAANRLVLGPEPWGFHLVNVLLHAIVALLVFLVIENWCGQRPIAWLAAALFAVHPIHTEVVNEVVGRGELLAAAFGLLALWLARRPGRGNAALALVAVAAALFSKEHAAVLLILLLFADWFLSARQRLSRHWSFYFALGLLGAAWLALRAFGVSRSVPPLPKDPYFVPLAFAEPWVRVTTALKLQWQALGKLVLPLDLQAAYATADPGAMLLQPGTIAGMAVLVVSLLLAGGVAWGVRRRQPLALPAALYLLSILPASNLFFVTGVTFAERLAYFPSIWFCVAVAMAVVGAAQSWKRFSRPWIAGVVVGALLLATWLRNPDFADPVRLWRKDVATSPENILAWMYLGSALFESTRTNEAEQAFRRMIELAPDFPEGLRTYADFLLQAGRPAEAAVLALRAIQNGGGNSPLSSLLLAEAQFKLNQFANALQTLDAADHHYRHYWYYWALRGMVLEALSRREEAVASYMKARPWPKKSDLAQRAGLLLLGMGRAADAEPVLREAVTGAGGAVAWNGLGVALAMQGRPMEARQAFEMAVQLDPTSRKYRENLQLIQ